jgi:hypothetical protein
MAQSIDFNGAGTGTVTIGGSTSLTPAPGKALANTNYLSNSNYTFAQQYLPDLYEKEFERYGNRSVASFLRMVGAEIPSSSDLIKWSEQGRLHLQDTGAIHSDGETIDGLTAHSFRVNQTIIISTASAAAQAKALITGVATDSITVKTFATLSLLDATSAADGAGPFDNDDAVTIFVYGSEFKKGVNGMDGSLEADFESKENNPIIIKDKYEVSGSEMAHIGWVEVTSENGASGYLWYLKSESETRLRFEDYLETAMIEGEPAIAGSAAKTAGYMGTKGLFYEVENNGNTTSGTIDSREDLEALAKVLDKEGAIQENVIFANRSTSFDIDKVLAAQNNSGASTASYGLFDNDEDMALNLGFTGFRIGYDFYKSDWKYLNDATTRGNVGGVDGIIVPAGTTTVYDQVLGENAKRPFLHVRYRVSPTEDRKYKSWVVGSAGGAATTDKDNMEVHFLSERALCTMGVNNFILMQ